MVLIQVERSDKEAVTEQESKFARQWFGQKNLGEMARDARMVMKSTGTNGQIRWTATRLDGQTIPVHSTEDPVAMLNQIQACRQGPANRPNLTIYEYGYLESGKLFNVEWGEKSCSSHGRTIPSLNESSFEIDETGCFVRVQKVQNSRRGLTCTITIKKTRRGSPVDNKPFTN